MWLCVAKASHSHKTWAEVSSSAPHFLHKGLSLSPIMWRKVSYQGVMSGKQANNHPGLRSIKGQQLGPNGNTRARDQLSSLSLSASKSLPQYQMLFIQPALNFLLYTLPWDSQGRLRSDKLVNGTPPCELILLKLRMCQTLPLFPLRICTWCLGAWKILLLWLKTISRRITRYHFSQACDSLKPGNEEDTNQHAHSGLVWPCSSGCCWEYWMRLWQWLGSHPPTWQHSMPVSKQLLEEEEQIVWCPPQLNPLNMTASGGTQAAAVVVSAGCGRWRNW